MSVNSLPETVTRQHRECDLNPGHSAPESSTLTTRQMDGSCPNWLQWNKLSRNPALSNPAVYMRYDQTLFIQQLSAPKITGPHRYNVDY